MAFYTLAYFWSLLTLTKWMLCSLYYEHDLHVEGHSLGLFCIRKCNSVYMACYVNIYFYARCRVFTSVHLMCLRHSRMFFLEILRVIHKSLWDFWPLQYSSRDGHAEGEHVNRRRDTTSFYPTLQVLDMSTLGDAADVNPVIKFLPHVAKSGGR
jgi:hypothetical protein